MTLDADAAITDDAVLEQAAPEEKKMGFTHDNKNNASVDWYTPPWVFEDLGLEFDLDPCHPEVRIPWIPVKKHYWMGMDGNSDPNGGGLTMPWEGLVWCNPPYGKFTGDWLAKMNVHRNGVALVFARTDTKWFFESVVNADAVLFLKGRIKFVDGLGVTGGGGAGSGSMLIAWGDEGVDALERMRHKGLLIHLGPI